MKTCMMKNQIKKKKMGLKNALPNRKLARLLEEHTFLISAVHLKRKKKSTFDTNGSKILATIAGNIFIS